MERRTPKDQEGRICRGVMLFNHFEFNTQNLVFDVTAIQTDECGIEHAIDSMERANFGNTFPKIRIKIEDEWIWKSTEEIVSRSPEEIASRSPDPRRKFEYRELINSRLRFYEKLRTLEKLSEEEQLVWAMSPIFESKTQMFRLPRSLRSKIEVDDCFFAIYPEHHMRLKNEHFDSRIPEDWDEKGPTRYDPYFLDSGHYKHAENTSLFKPGFLRLAKGRLDAQRNAEFYDGATSHEKMKGLGIWHSKWMRGDTWIEALRVSHKEIDFKCCVTGCRKDAFGGAHLENDENKILTFWVVPMCNQCNLDGVQTPDIQIDKFTPAIIDDRDWSEIRDEDYERCPYCEIEWNFKQNFQFGPRPCLECGAMLYLDQDEDRLRESKEQEDW